jgi:hypothetical protein
LTKDVTFEPVEGPINDLVDEAYRVKYRGSPYLDPMTGARARSATVVLPNEAGLSYFPDRTLAQRPSSRGPAHLPQGGRCFTCAASAR